MSLHVLLQSEESDRRSGCRSAHGGDEGLRWSPTTHSTRQSVEIR
jgi:hypothetical protein